MLAVEGATGLSVVMYGRVVTLLRAVLSYHCCAAGHGAGVGWLDRIAVLLLSKAEPRPLLLRCMVHSASCVLHNSGCYQGCVLAREELYVVRSAGADMTLYGRQPDCVQGAVAVRGPALPCMLETRTQCTALDLIWYFFWWFGQVWINIHHTVA
jgi:hypothetical protein